MNDQLHVLDIREAIIDRLGCPEPELPGVEYVGVGNRDCYALHELFDELCLYPMGARMDLVEEAMTLLEQIRGRDYATFYLGRSELLRLFPVQYDPPTAPDGDETAPLFGLRLSDDGVIALSEVLGLN